jgi:hypothetical protein
VTQASRQAGTTVGKVLITKKERTDNIVTSLTNLPLSKSTIRT